VRLRLPSPNRQVSEPSQTLLRETPLWRRLEWHFADVRHSDLRDLFEGDPSRGERLAGEAAGLYFDYSKNLLTDETLELLRKLAVEHGVRERVSDLFRSARAGGAGDRNALHLAFRMEHSKTQPQLERMNALADEIATGAWVGATGRRIRAVVNICVGGGHLGSALVWEALHPRAATGLDCRFVSNVDPDELAAALSGLEPAETLFVTLHSGPGVEQTAVNTAAARSWLRASLGPKAGLDRHLLAVGLDVTRTSSALEIPGENVVSVWGAEDGLTTASSPAGLAVCIALGPAVYRELLAGFRALDEHFASSPLGGNLPAIAGLIAVWYRNFHAATSRAVVPYSRALRLLPDYVRYLTVALTGTSIDSAGTPVDVGTGPVVWGGTGTETEHVFSELLHQGTTLVPVDLIGVARHGSDDGGPRDVLAASLLAQAEALAFGEDMEELEDLGVSPEVSRDHERSGNRPSSVVLMRELDPRTLGALLAFYEHSALTQAAIWELAPFRPRRSGREEELASRLLPELAANWKHELMHDSSTNALIRRYRRFRDARD
jgi:glucose-6-phosphate isomerase